MTKILNILNDNFLKENKCVFKKYKPIKKIGVGTYGNVYSVLRLKDKKMFAMKIEKTNTLFKTLESEAYFLLILQGGIGIPKFITYGRKKNYNILIESLLNKNLYNIYIEKCRQCNLIDACLIGLQVLDRLKWIHSKDLIYRDIKPGNFLIGINDPNIIYIVDFGLCKKYRSSKTGKHILPKRTGKFFGTLKYASSFVIEGKEPSRRDDLIGLGYMLIFLLKKVLPWQINCEVLKKKNYNELIRLKETDGDGKLFQNIPEELKEYIKYTKNLKFEQNPDYSYMSSLFTKILFKINLNYRKLTFSWINPKDKHLLGIPKNNTRRKSSPHLRLLKSIEIEINKRSTDNFLSVNGLKCSAINNNSTNCNINRNDSEPNIITFQKKRKLAEQKLKHYQPKKCITNSGNYYKSIISKKISPKKEQSLNNTNNNNYSNINTYYNDISLYKKNYIINSQIKNSNNNKFYQSIFKIDKKENKIMNQNNLNNNIYNSVYFSHNFNNSNDNKSYNNLKKTNIYKNKKYFYSNNTKIYGKINNNFNISNQYKTYKSPLKRNNSIKKYNYMELNTFQNLMNPRL